MPPSKVLKGLGVSEGIGIGLILQLAEPQMRTAGPEQASDVQGELLRYRVARDSVRDRIRQAAVQVSKEPGAGDINILDVHVMLLDDPALCQEVESQIQAGRSAERAVESVFQTMAARLKAAKNEYLRDRHLEFGHIRLELVLELSGARRLDTVASRGDVILVARELTPCALVNLPENVKGVALEMGGASSHVAILARAYKLPLVLGVKDILKKTEEGAPSMINGGTGQLVLHPSVGRLEDERTLLRGVMAVQAKDMESAGLPAETRDGRRIPVFANVGGLPELHAFGGSGADGIGLLRTEFLFLHRQTPPTEDEQFEAFKLVAQASGRRETVIRTVDFGGDKQAPFLTHSEGTGPSASLRGIRLCLENPAFFRTHLRAILRASAFGEIKIMFPMVSGLETFRKGKAIIKEVLSELSREAAPHTLPVAVGAMVEVPSAALMSGVLAREVDFFSIGTNDLIQYSLGVERDAPILPSLRDFLPPSVVHLMELVVRSAHAEGKKVAVCGEIARNPHIIPLLIGMGVDALSMDASGIPAAKRVVRGVLHSQCKALAERVTQLETPSEIAQYLTQAGPSLL